MPAPTTHYTLSKPTVGGDADSWGTDLNNNTIEKVDGILARHGLPRNAPTVSAGAVTLDLSLARVFTFTVSGADVTATVTNFPTVDPTNPYVRFWVIASTTSAFNLTFTGFQWSELNPPNFKIAGQFVIEVVSIAAGVYFASVLHSSVNKQMPFAQVAISADQLVTGDGDVAATFSDPALIDTHAMWNVATPTRLTVPAGQAGIYRIAFFARFATLIDREVDIKLRKQAGSVVLATSSIEGPNAGKDQCYVEAYAVLAVGDVIEVLTNNADTTDDYTILGTASFAGCNHFTMERIR